VQAAPGRANRAANAAGPRLATRPGQHSLCTVSTSRPGGRLLLRASVRVVRIAKGRQAKVSTAQKYCHGAFSSTHQSGGSPAGHVDVGAVVSSSTRGELISPEEIKSLEVNTLLRTLQSQGSLHPSEAPTKHPVPALAPLSLRQASAN